MTNFYSLASSSSGNCSVFLGGGRAILIDAGTNCKYITESLAKLGLALSDITDVLITHTHTDHISALPVLTKRCKAPIRCTELTGQGLFGRCSHEDIQTFSPNQGFWLGEVFITAFSTPHDCPGSCGFTLETADGKLAYCTDLGQVTPEIYRQIKGSHTAFLESNHDIYMLKNGEYPYPLNTPAMALRESQEALEKAGLAGLTELSVAPKRAIGQDMVLLRRVAG